MTSGTPRAGCHMGSKVASAALSSLRVALAGVVVADRAYHVSLSNRIWRSRLSFLKILTISLVTMAVQHLDAET